MEWNNVGEWLKANAGSGAALVGSLLTGNIPAAVALGVKLVATATGQADPAQALEAFQQDPATVVRLRELALQEQASINGHIEKMTELDLTDKQAEHKETQDTIREGDNAEDPFVRRTRPGMAWVSLIAALVYAIAKEDPSFDILGALLVLPLAYCGLRQIGHWAATVSAVKAAK